MKTPTISEIKLATEEKSPYFFTRKSMKFFGQVMRDFRVKQTSKGNIYIYAPTYTGKGGSFFGYTIRQFTGNDLKLVSDCPKGKHDLDRMLEWFDKN